MTASTDQLEYRKKRALEKALGFLTRASSFHRGRGISHSYSFWLNPIDGFYPAYPEVTGYTIPTLIRAGEFLERPDLIEISRKSADWLCEIQSPEGWFYGGIERANGPSVFNSAMILFGLSAAAQKFGDKKYLDSLIQCVDWLLDVQEDDGFFLKYAWSDRFQPAYYTRVAWALLMAESLTGNKKIIIAVEKLNQTLQPFFTAEGIREAGFEPGQPAFLHTMAYALRGAHEVNRVIPNTYDLSFLNKLVSEYGHAGQWPGQITFDQERNISEFDHSFRCLTGEAQMAILLGKTGKKKMASRTIEGLMDLQGRFGKKQGALPGSHPVWGAYMKWRYPSWASKFLVDALMENLGGDGQKTSPTGE